jgi:hypothetical protein
MDDRSFANSINEVHAVAYPYLGSQEIPMSGPIAEALFLNKYVIIHEETWISRDIDKIAPDNLINNVTQLEEIILSKKNSPNLQDTKKFVSTLASLEHFKTIFDRKN